MNINRLVIGTVVGGVAMFILDFVFWGLLFADFFASNAGSATGVLRETQVIWAMGLGTLCYAALIALAIETRPGTPSIADGLKIGAVVGLLMWGSVDLIYYGIGNLWNLTAHMTDVALEGVRAAIGGIVIVGARKVAG